MDSNNKNPKFTPVTHSNPIAISAARRRSASVSSSSSGSSNSPIEPHTPISWSHNRTATSPSSPILSYFLAQSPTTPTKLNTNTFPFKRNFPAPCVPEANESTPEPPVAAHARRASTAFAGRFSQQHQAQQPAAPLSDMQHERGTGLLRRLSLSSAFARPPMDLYQPPAPPNSAVTPPGDKELPSRPVQIGTSCKPRRAATVSEPRRAPSPMGERILKGHFDGFN